MLGLGAGVLVVLVLRSVWGVGGAAVPSLQGLGVARRNVRGLACRHGGRGLESLAHIERPGSHLALHDVTRSCGCWIGLLVDARGCVLMTTARERRRETLMGLAWVALAFGCDLGAHSRQGGFGDRFLYWPMAGFSIVMGLCFSRWWKLFVPLLHCLRQF